MTLFVSDIHFGRSDAATERAKETALIACLQAHADRAERLFLVGDVFDQYIEYRHLVPKGFVRFQGLLAAWSDRGVPITYLAGNHDPWHRDYFEKEMGVRVVMEHVLEPCSGADVYVAHGDAPDPSRRYQWLRPLFRNPVLTSLYRALLPADAGFGFARWVDRAGRHEVIEPRLVAALRRHAQRVLEATAARAVVMGHSHHPELCQYPHGSYLNTGSWYDRRTFGVLDDGHLRLLRWTGGAAEVLDEADWP